MTLTCLHLKENTLIIEICICFLKMKKTNWYNVINRNNDAIFNGTNHTSRGTMMGSEIYLNHRWLHDEDITTGVQIIELKSSDSSDTSLDKHKDKQENAEKNNYDQFQIGDSGGNISAREKRRLKYQSPENRNSFAEKNINHNVNDDTHDKEHFYREFYASSSTDKDENIVVNHQMNCFTILDKHYAVTSENSSEEDYNNIDVTDCDLPTEYTLNNFPRENDIVPYDNEADNETRMVWIYSFKNKRLLSENDFELVNIPSQDLSTANNCIEDLPEFNNLDNNVTRIATPVPPTFVPRLNLTMTSTLPTVTEVTEPSEQKSSPEATEEVANDIDVKPKRLNNWFYSENATPNSKDINGTSSKKSRNVVDWMALSPREKRRRLKNSSPVTPCESQFPSLCEVNSTVENVNFVNRNPCSDGYPYDGYQKGTSNTERKTDTCKQNNYTPSQKYDIPKLKTDTPSQKSDTPKQNSCTPAKKAGNGNASSQKREIAEPVTSFRRESSAKDYSFNRTVTPSTCSSHTRELNYSKITTMEILNEQQDTPEDRGDYIKTPKTRRPQINIRPRPFLGSAISNPIENLNSDDWIIENSLEVSNDNREYIIDPPKEHGDGVGNVIFMKHMSLFKPAEWEAYLPITESIPSLSLSANTDSANNSRSWLKRFRKIFPCCK